MMVIEEVPEGTLKVTTFPTVCVPSGISCTAPALDTTGLRQVPAAGCEQSLAAPHAGVVDATIVGGAVQAGTSLHAGGLSSPHERVAARGRAQAAMHNVRILTSPP